MDREPVDPVGEGVGLIPEFGVPGPAGPPVESLLLAPDSSYNHEKIKLFLVLTVR